MLPVGWPVITGGFRGVYFRTAAYHRAGKLKLAVPTMN
jgi:hypothetical protein